MFYSGNWVDSVPQNFQWSNATLVTKGMAPYGAVALAEIDGVVQRLPQRTQEPPAGGDLHRGKDVLALLGCQAADIARAHQQGAQRCRTHPQVATSAQLEKSDSRRGERQHD